MESAWEITGTANVEFDEQTRKRPRSVSPTPASLVKQVENKFSEKDELAKQLGNAEEVNKGLNRLMEMTASHELIFTLENDDSLMKALVDLVDYEKGEKIEIDCLEELIPARAWKLFKRQPKFPLSTIPLLHAVLVIFRNFSFVAANLRPMTQELSVMRLLIDCLYLDNTELLIHSVFTLANLAPVLDVTGQKILADKLFLDNADNLHKLGWGGLQFAKQLDDSHQVSVDKIVLWEGTREYVTQIWHIFSGLRHIFISPQTPRPILLQSMDWIRELLEHNTPSTDIPSMYDIFREMPQDVIQKLIDCLWIPRLGPDALDYINPITNIVSRVSTLKLFMGYDATVDTDLRDRALESLQQLLELGLSLPSSPRLYNALLPCLTTKVGRNDAQTLACGIYKSLGKSEIHQEGLLYVQERMLELASKDSRVAQVALGHLYVRHD
mmetsp:Transcript_15603/g.22992  ORF Transcript_15603/g.22992 Transcript_15603/m.22992 type:complete len:440 (+) Transcript_15603:101-1420(+)|eukprot:CAMPEP_0194225314 /NCGR_PEP_ID=MMETSP0156-20130528/39349_1 /TAXON_ID=33649 /ORGANISM="Thalassionema nitzschioides, Strain L26-B" /LENGTH=439 /DNA_ID=CAMNT_0038957227 /DNA_START=66 /DNA_END=1385 /DNA_ORIENTATION=+